MRNLHILHHTLLILLLAVGEVSAQQADNPSKSVEFADRLQIWRQSQDLEEKISVGEELVAREGALAPWPLAEPREQVRAELGFVVGSAYVMRPRGVRADNLESAISHLKAALGIRTREANAQDWARVHNSLGIAYWARIRGERADNQEEAIAHFEAALTVFTRDAEAREWAQLQNNLGIAYWNRIRGEHGDNLERAIALFEAALTVFTREADSTLWGQVQNNLGIAYRSRVEGERAENREKAIQHFEAALGVLARDTAPLEWAYTQNNLANAYLNRLGGDRADNQETAAAHLQAALTVFTREAYPREWATAQRGTGDVLAERIRGEPGENRARAIAAYEAALSVFTRDTFPLQHMETARTLARNLMEAKEWQKAGRVHASAREAFLLLFGQGLEETETRALIAEAGPLFAEAAFAAVERGEVDGALELANEGRARLLAVAMKLQALDLPADARRRLDELRTAIRAEQQAIDTARGVERAAALEKLAASRLALLQLVTSGAPRGDGKAETTIARVRKVLGQEGGAVVMPIVTALGGKLVVVTVTADGTRASVVDLPDLTPERLAGVLIGTEAGKPAGWIAAYFINYLDGEERASRWPEWTGAIDGLGPELWRLFAGRLHAVLKEQGLRSGTRVFWLPSGWLGILPLGLAQDPASKRRFIDDHELVYAPSLEALVVANEAAGKAGPATLAAIVNPTGDLPGTENEGEIVASHFGAKARVVLREAAATPAAVLGALKGRSYWHFASHGSFSWEDARSSALVLHDMAPLTVGRLLETDGLGRPRLVVLSACETGLYDIRSSPDEFVGLPGAFIALGAAGVLGTLWPVSDAATALLIARFYELHLGGGLSPPTALRRAQAWLREANNDDLAAYAKLAAARGRLNRRRLAEIERDVSADGLRHSRNSALVEWLKPGATETKTTGRTATATGKTIARPYAHPYFWAGFIYTGL
ncbi:MAG TPA: CHAT domain-containing protein [Hyphomicrobiaceae bacterium]|nr:CHAT domain-containing protein [Hyphomicrobiaceae bacterium]